MNILKVELGSHELNEAAWKFFKVAVNKDIPIEGKLFNELKPILQEAIQVWEDSKPPVMMLSALKRECDDVDEILRWLNIDLSQCRSEGGSLKVNTIKDLLDARHKERITEVEAENRKLEKRIVAYSITNTQLHHDKELLMQAIGGKR